MGDETAQRSVSSGRDDSLKLDSCGACPLLRPRPPAPEGRALTMPRIMLQGMMGGDACSLPVGKGWMGRFGLRVWVLHLIAAQFPRGHLREGNRLGCLRGAIVWVTVACPPTVDTERENRHPGSRVQPGLCMLSAW